MSLVGEQDITLRRRNSATGGRDPVTGRWSAATVNVDTVIKATVNPITGEALATLPEGERTSHQIRVLTDATEDVRTADQAAGTLADHIIWRGDIYEVRDIQRYTEIIPHLEIRARRLS